MTDHLPDCDDYAFSGAGFHPKCERICICRQVRRIEHRVFQEQIEGRQSGSRQPDEDYAYKTGSDNGFDAGLNAGLDAAREVVAPMEAVVLRIAATLVRHPSEDDLHDALQRHWCGELKAALFQYRAAIDALKESND